MEAVSFLSGWITWLLIIVPIGAGTTMTYFSFKKSLSTDEDEISICDRRMKQTLKGAVIAITISGIVTIAKTWFR